MIALTACLACLAWGAVLAADGVLRERPLRAWIGLAALYAPGLVLVLA